MSGFFIIFCFFFKVNIGVFLHNRVATLPGRLLCFWERENRCAILSNWSRLMEITPWYVTRMGKRALCQRLPRLLTRDHVKLSKPSVPLQDL